MMSRSIHTVLIANRGEIARRLFRACRELGLTSVAVHSDADTGSVWSREADLGVRLPGTSAADTYLNAAAILAAAREVGADAIHPGYGFLSENADFAEACADASLKFVGPTPRAMRILGSKSSGRQAAATASVPVIPGVDGLNCSDEELATQASLLGYPVLIKACASGGGRGMRIVEEPGAFAESLRAARAEALSAFGNDHMLLEKFFGHVRHVEVQLLGDEHGNVVHLFERECSIQRRHQKLVEESPSPTIDSGLRGAMTEAAVALAHRVGYTSAGTVEFLVDEDGRFHFLEMNTRLQVEHSVTEMVTGVDLAAWQLRIAAGEPLGFGQEEVGQRGHAIECRVYAEDPAQAFLPSTGTIALYRPPGGPGVRCDDSVTTGSVVTSHYDPLLAKIIALGWDRCDALRRIRQALAETVVLGITTNLPFLQDIVAHAAFQAGQTTTHFLEDHMADWRWLSEATEDEWLAMAAFESLAAVAQTIEATPDCNGLQVDPWSGAEGWRNVR